MASYLAFLDPVRVVRVTRAPIKHWPVPNLCPRHIPFPAPDSRFTCAK